MLIVSGIGFVTGGAKGWWVIGGGLESEPAPYIPGCGGSCPAGLGPTPNSGYCNLVCRVTVPFKFGPITLMEGGWGGWAKFEWVTLQNGEWVHSTFTPCAPCCNAGSGQLGLAPWDRSHYCQVSARKACSPIPCENSCCKPSFVSYRIGLERHTCTLRLPAGLVTLSTSPSTATTVVLRKMHFPVVFALDGCKNDQWNIL